MLRCIFYATTSDEIDNDHELMTMTNTIILFLYVRSESVGADAQLART